jgi:tetratricopeptide (TPR) repeat protein
MTNALPLLLAGLLAIAAPPAALAAGGGDETRPPAGAPQKPVDPDYTAAEKAIRSGNYAAAIPLLERVVARDGANADAYNWLGYAVRKSGDPAKSIPIYQKALSLNPEHRGAHEYIGEAYLQLDDLGKAREHLTRLDKLCFFSCEEYRDLKKAVEAYEKKNGRRR